jgi:hypothetical protein
MGTVQETVNEFKNVSMAVLLGFSGMTILIGFAGMTCLCKPCLNNGVCWAVLYGIAVFVLWIVMLVVGAIVTGVSLIGTSQIESFCKGEIQNDRFTLIHD